MTECRMAQQHEPVWPGREMQEAERACTERGVNVESVRGNVCARRMGYDGVVACCPRKEPAQPKTRSLLRSVVGAVSAGCLGSTSKLQTPRQHNRNFAQIYRANIPATIHFAQLAAVLCIVQHHTQPRLDLRNALECIRHLEPLQVLRDPRHFVILDEINQLVVRVTWRCACAGVALATERHVGQVESEEGYGGWHGGFET